MQRKLNAAEKYPGVIVAADFLNERESSKAEIRNIVGLKTKIKSHYRDRSYQEFN